MAKDWKTVPEQISCNTPNALDEPILIGAREERPIKLDASSYKSIKFLEHLHLHIDLKTQVSLIPIRVHLYFWSRNCVKHACAARRGLDVGFMEFLHHKFTPLCVPDLNGVNPLKENS